MVTDPEMLFWVATHAGLFSFIGHLKMQDCSPREVGFCFRASTLRSSNNEDSKGGAIVVFVPRILCSCSGQFLCHGRAVAAVWLYVGIQITENMLMVRKQVKSYRIQIRRACLQGLLLLLLPVLAACSAAPGMNIGTKMPQAGVEPVMKEITPQLVQEERAVRDKLLDQEISELFSEPRPYTVGPNDVVSFDMLGQSEMKTSVSVVMAPLPNSAADSMVSSGFAVDAEGQLHLPYVGAVKVAGLTERELHELLVQLYSKYIKKPELNVRVQSYRSKRLYVDGEIRNPGVLPIIDIQMTLPEALSRAGGATTMGDLGAVSLSRSGRQYTINVPQLAAHGVNPSQIMLKDGDLLRVPPREEGKVFVLGEVTTPSAVLPHNGRLTLNEALGNAGGVNTASGEPRQIYVVRRANDLHPIVYHLDAASPVALALAESFELQAKDVVYVDATSLARWNRVVSLLLPTAQLIVDSKYLSVIK